MSPQSKTLSLSRQIKQQNKQKMTTPTKKQLYYSLSSFYYIISFFVTLYTPLSPTKKLVKILIFPTLESSTKTSFTTKNNHFIPHWFFSLTPNTPCSILQLHASLHTITKFSNNLKKKKQTRPRRGKMRKMKTW